MIKIFTLYCGYKIYYDKKGYATIWLNRKNKKVHVLEWEKAHGPKPNGYILHHIDENKANWALNNLKLVTHSDHLKIHAGWLMEDGIWIKKPCKDCNQLLTLDKFYQRKGLTPSQRCISCSSGYFKEVAKDKKFKKRRKLYMKQYYDNYKHEKWGIKN